MQQGRALVLSSAQQQQLAPSSRGGGGQQLAGGSRSLGGVHSMEAHVAGLEKSLATEGAHIHTLQEAIKDVRGKVFSVQDVVVQSRMKVMKHEEATQAEASRAEIQIQLLAERQRLVEEVSTEHQLLLAAETALLNEEAEHTCVFLRNLAANEALIRGLHSLAPPPGSDPQPPVHFSDPMQCTHDSRDGRGPADLLEEGAKEQGGLDPAAPGAAYINAVLEARKQATVQKEIADVRRRVACLVLLAAD